jgi:hypothetical protein
MSYLKNESGQHPLLTATVQYKIKPNEKKLTPLLQLLYFQLQINHGLVNNLLAGIEKHRMVSVSRNAPLPEQIGAMKETIVDHCLSIKTDYERAIAARAKAKGFFAAPPPIEDFVHDIEAFKKAHHLFFEDVQNAYENLLLKYLRLETAGFTTRFTTDERVEFTLETPFAHMLGDCLNVAKQLQQVWTQSLVTAQLALSTMKSPPPSPAGDRHALPEIEPAANPWAKALAMPAEHPTVFASTPAAASASAPAPASAPAKEAVIPTVGPDSPCIN